MHSYLVPAEPVSHTEEVKKSRFIVDLAHTPGVQAAKDFVQQVKQRYPDARHHCWAYVAAAPNNSVDIGCSDDGEPSGTAGKPILAQLQGSGIGEITAVVSRYFGGTKLGTGGLVKAYGGSVQQALLQLQKQTKVISQNLELTLDYADQNTVMQVLNSADAEVLKQQFSDKVALLVAVPVAELKTVKLLLVDKTQGRIKIQDQH